MYKIGQYLVYKKDVCKVNNIKEKEGKEYYQLAPVDDDSLKIEVPIDNKNLRDIMSKIDLENLINSIPSIEIIDCSDRMIELEYRNLISTGSKEDLIKVIKTAYLRNKERIANKKRLSEKDTTYQEKAEKLLYNEFSIVLNKTFDQVKEYIINKVEALV